MTFVHPDLLWFLSLLLLPLIIHLFQFKRYRRFAFSSLAFVKAVEREQTKTRRLKHFLILLARLFFIGLIVIAIANPYWKTEGKSDNFSTILLDNTVSNDNIGEGNVNSILEINSASLDDLAEIYKADIQLTLADGDIGNIEGLGNYTAVKNVSGFNWDNDISHGKSILWFSDFQRNVLDDNLELLSDTSKSLVLIPGYTTEVRGTVIVDSIYSKSGVEVEDNSGIIAVLRSSKGILEEVNVTLSNGVNLLGSHNIPSLNTSSVAIEFQAPRLKGKATNYILGIDDGYLTYDNEFYFTHSVQEIRNILLLYSDLDDKKLLEEAYGNNDLFRITAVDIKSFSFTSLDQYDVIIASIDNSVNDFTLKGLKAFLSSGKTLFVYPNSALSRYNTFEELIGQSTATLDNTDLLNISPPDYSNPFFNNIFDNKDNRKIEMPQATPYFNMYAGQSILSYTNGESFLSRYGTNNNIFVMNSSITGDVNNFRSHPLFLPVLYKIAYNNSSEGSTSYHYLNDPVVEVTDISLNDNSTVFKLKKGEQEFIPDQVRKGDQLNLILPKENLEEGFYDLVDSKTDSTITTIALNIPKEESTLDFYDATKLKEKYGRYDHITILENNRSETLVEFIEQTKEGIPLWKYFLVLALLCLLAEILIIRLVK